jgi:hypothetical protein
MTPTTTKKYIVLASGVMMLFVNFIACGSQMYKVSMEGDVDSRNNQAENGETALGIHSSGGWVNLPISIKFGSDLTQGQKEQAVMAMYTWERAVGKRLFNLGSDKQTGDGFPDLYSSLADALNGGYMRNNWGATGKPTVVLATAIWNNSSVEPSKIATADLHYNQEYYVIGDSLSETAAEAREIVDMESLSLHELGHLLGLSHVASDDDPLSIMNPSLFIGEGLTSRKISRGDIERIQSIYGCEGEACDIDTLLTQMELGLTNKTAAAH